MNDLAPLAQQVVQFLTPFLPYLLKAVKLGGTKAIEKAGEKMSEESLTQAKNLWKKLSHKEQIKTAAETMAAHPENPAGQEAFTQAVAQALQEDEKLQRATHRIISKVKVGNVLVGGSVTGVATKTPKKKLKIESEVETGDVSGKVTGVTFEG